MSEDSDKKKGVSRRRAMKTVVAAIPAAVAGSALIGAPAGQAQPARVAGQDHNTVKQLAAVHDHGMAFHKLKLLADDPASLKQYTAMVNEVVGSMVKDGQIAAQILGQTDSVLLINLYDVNRKQLEPLIGKVDGRTIEGRYRKIIHATELFEDVSGFDSGGLLHAQELGATAELASSSSSSSSGCSGCDAGGSSFLGCCIIHFWGWSAGDSGCSPCATPVALMDAS